MTEKFVLQLKRGFFLVPYNAVTVNCMYLPQLNTAPQDYKGPFAMVAPSGRVVDGESSRAFMYESIQEAEEDVERLWGEPFFAGPSGPEGPEHMLKIRRFEEYVAEVMVAAPTLEEAIAVTQAKLDSDGWDAVCSSDGEYEDCYSLVMTGRESPANQSAIVQWAQAVYIDLEPELFEEAARANKSQRLSIDLYAGQILRLKDLLESPQTKPLSEDVTPQQRLATFPEVAEWLDSYYESVAEEFEDVSEESKRVETIGAFEDNLEDMTKEDALESMWLLVDCILKGMR